MTFSIEFAEDNTGGTSVNIKRGRKKDPILDLRGLFSKVIKECSDSAKRDPHSGTRKKSIYGAAISDSDIIDDLKATYGNKEVPPDDLRSCLEQVWPRQKNPKLFSDQTIAAIRDVLSQGQSPYTILQEFL